MTTSSIRLADEADIPRLFEISTDTHHSGYEGYIPGQFKDAFAHHYALTEANRDIFDRVARSRLRSSKWTYYVYEHEKTAVAYLCVRIIDEMTIALRGLFVDPRYQGMGIGGDLMKRLIADNNYVTITLQVLSQNLTAITMYRRYGFVETGTASTRFFGAELVSMIRVVVSSRTTTS